MNHQNQAAGQAESPLASFEKSAKREKTWDECGIEEKVERLRHQLLMTREAAQYTSRTASSAQELAMNHQHNPATGEVLQGVRRHGGAEIGAGTRFDPLR